MIRRIRIGFVLLAVVLLAPLALLLTRTLDGLERERERRHGAVASRVFDEAERQLGTLLRDEEARPAEQYRALLGSGRTSPLAGAPDHDFVVGYFQVDGAGELGSPRADASDAFLSELRAMLPTPSRATPRAEGAAELFAAKERAKRAQRPGTTRVVQKLDVTGRAAAEEEELLEAPTPAGGRSLTSYGVLEQLNRATRLRRDSLDSSPDESAYEEKRALSKAESATSAESDAVDRRAMDDAPLPEAIASAAGPVAPRAEPSAPEPERSAPVADAFAPMARPVAPAALAPAVRPASPPAGPRLRTLELGPSRLSGTLVGPERLVLHRTAAVPGEPGPVHQGLLVEIPGLTAWLRAEVLGRAGLLDSLALEFRASDGEASPWRDVAAPPDRFVYEHRFGEPFDALSARLTLAPLPDEGGTRYVYWMGLLLVVASTVGLWAVYRRVAVAVHFAERRSNFVAAVSHELKTPLTAIRMYAEMLRDGMVPDEARRQEYYGTITAESERLTRLINNVLEFSKLEGERRELAPLVAPIEPCLRDVLRVLEPHAAALGFTLRLELEPGLPAAAHDPDALEQILFNLVDNALKYARDAEPREVVVTAAAAGEGVAVRVRDHGPGVAPDHLPHVFEAFYRGQDELTRRTKGTGIGLALVQGLAQQMKGRVTARNHPDGGLEVELRLPRSAA